MKTFTLAVVWLVSVAVAQNAAKPPISVNISTTRAEYTIGEPIKLDIALTNNSDKEIAVAQSNAVGKAELSYDIDVRDTTGKRAERTHYGKVLRGEDPEASIMDSQRTRHLKPHDVLGDSAMLTTIYDLSAPGQYVVRVTKEKKFPGLQPDEPVVSNAIKITITKPAS